jgi:hypothetical protein
MGSGDKGDRVKHAVSLMGGLLLLGLIPGAFAQDVRGYIPYADRELQFTSNLSVLTSDGLQDSH